jgi:HPt (histidine-containing phosphotransfer) domain-containing protein
MIISEEQETTMEVPLKLKLNYIERRKSEIPLCQTSLDQRDFKTLERVGHQLKGNGLTFGFENLAKIGADLESAAKSENYEASVTLVARLAEAVQQLDSSLG